jgi:hypothetical protein
MLAQRRDAPVSLDSGEKRTRSVSPDGEGAFLRVEHRPVHMIPAVTTARIELRSKLRSKDDFCCWHVGYEFCGVTAELTVYARDQVEAHANAVDQLRMRGLKVS